MPSCLVEDSRLSSWRRTCLLSGNSPGVMARGHDSNSWGLGGIERQRGAGFLKAIQEFFEKWGNRRQGIGIKQGSHPLPQQAFTAQLAPDRLKQRTTEL